MSIKQAREKFEGFVDFLSTDKDNPHLTSSIRLGKEDLPLLKEAVNALYLVERLEQLHFDLLDDWVNGKVDYKEVK